MGNDEIQEASAAANVVTGYASYLAGMEYSVEQYKEGIAAISEYTKSQGG
jgi:hypothetical protein